jgi:serine/threonine-protein kinase
VAIKVLAPAHASSPEWRERFHAEARVMAGLSHPCIVPVHAAGERDGIVWYAMPWVRGESLGARLRREGRLPADEARRILAQVADALDYVHRRGVVHRDVKPENVLIEDETGRPVLVDFGIAADPIVHRRRGAGGTAVGTPWYMSPEQVAADAELDGRSDVYALGVLGYLALSGRLPFDGATFEEIAAQHLSREPVALRKLAPRTPRDLAAAVTRCLAKDPAARWPNAGAFARAVAVERASCRDRALKLARAAGRGIAAATAFLFAW